MELDNRELIRSLEYPPPILKVRADQLVVEATALGVSGEFMLENAGGGVLSGVIMANSPCVRFEEERFEGNRVRVRYSVGLEGAQARAGDVIQTSAIIMSNGGESVVPIAIHAAPPAIETEEGVKITSLKAFLAYAMENEPGAGRLFASEGFQEWLADTGFEMMDIYESLREDPDKTRALHLFFTLCKMKRETVLTCDQEPLSFETPPNVSEMITGRLQVKKTGWGFLDEEVAVAGVAKWLEVVPKRLRPPAFGGGDTAEVIFKINTSLIGAAGGSDSIVIGGHASVPVSVKIKEALDVSLDKEFYVFGETGGILCVNNTGKDALLDVAALDGFIRFEGTRFKVGRRARIPFTLRHTAATLAQISLKKQPTLMGRVAVSNLGGGAPFEKTLTLAAGAGFMPDQP